MKKMKKVTFSPNKGINAKTDNVDKAKLIKRKYGKQKSKIKRNKKLFANHDILTDLPNSVYFLKKLDNKIEESKIKNNKGAVIYIDIDNYKIINDNYGYSLGDLVLKLFSKLLHNCVVKYGEIARLNGDEFAILVNDFKSIKEIEDICNRIYENLKKPFKVMNMEVKISVSMGIAVFPDNSTETNELLKFCDFAMYKSKHQGKNTYTIFNNDSLDNYYRKILIKNELKSAINKNELSIVYQPQINILTNEIVGIESLLRWNNDKLGVISPMEFIPIAEKTGDIIQIGNWVIDNVLRQSTLWRKMGYKFEHISVNISPIQIIKKDFKDDLLKYCEKYKVPDNFLEIEITEGTLIDVYKEKIEILDELIHNGINIAIDDFGTGYSSLSYLINIPINTLKIDKSFVDNIENYKNKVLIKSIVNLSKDLKYKIITEGVETKKQINLLMNLGCNIIQGFYFSKPIPKEEMEVLLKNNREIVI